MRLLLCCLTIASVAVSFGMAHNLDEDLYKIFVILRSVTEMYAELFPEGYAKRFSEYISDAIETLGILRSSTKYKIEWSDVQVAPEDLFKVYTKLLPEGNAKHFTEHVFRTFDSDNSGRIDISEAHLVIKIFLYAMPEEKLELVFQFSDVNGDGTIEPSETTDIIGAFYDMLPSWLISDPSYTPESQAREIFAEFDENNDGVLSKDEFIRGCLANEFTNLIVTTNFSEWSELPTNDKNAKRTDNQEL